MSQDKLPTNCQISVPISFRAESGFHHVGPQCYQPRLLHFHGHSRGVQIRERPLNQHSLDSTDVFILDLGSKAYQVSNTHEQMKEQVMCSLCALQWNGCGSNKDERFRAALYIHELKVIPKSCL